MLENQRKVTVQLLDEQVPQRSFSVESLFAQIQRGVKNVREADPDLKQYHLHDVSLRVLQGSLVAELDFRK